MGNKINDSNICCCNKYVKDLCLSLEENKEGRYDIILKNKYEVNSYNQDKTNQLLIDIEKKPWIKNFIILINQILKNNKQLSKKFLDEIKKIFEKVLDEFLNKDEKFFYLNNFNSIGKTFDLETINIFLNLFKIIYNKKNKISKETIIYFIKSIDYILKDEELLDENEKDYIISILKEIYYQEKKSTVEKINNIEYSEKEIFLKEEIKIDNADESNSNNSFRSKISSYSKDSQSQITKMKEEINDLKLIIENSMIKNEKKNILN